MHVWFWSFVILLIISVPLHFRSVEHSELKKKYGSVKGVFVVKIYGYASGSLEALVSVGLWVSPQPYLFIPINLKWIISIPLLILGVFVSFDALRVLGLKAAETHLPKRIVREGVYSYVRHPMYLGWILTHISLSLIFSASYALLFTPALIAIIFLISYKEEEELIKEFGTEYDKYKRKTSMFLPLV